MRQRIFLALLTFAVAVFAGPLPSFAQNPASSPTEEIPNMGRAPKEPNGIGRLDLRVFDEEGRPVKNAYAKLESTRTDGFFCESWGYTDARGVAVLPPLHMGRLKLIVKAPGYQKQTLTIPASNLSEPVRVTLVRKK